MLMVLGLGGYITYDKVLSNKDTESASNDTEEKEENQKIEYEIITLHHEGKNDTKTLKVNEKIVTFNNSTDSITEFSALEVYPIGDVLVVSAMIDDLGYQKILVVNNSGKVISMFSDNINDDKVVSINVLKSTLRPKFDVKGNSIYITTDNLGQDDIYHSCTYYKNDKNYIVVQTEKFDYLENGKFSSAELVDSVTAQEYISTNNIECSGI